MTSSQVKDARFRLTPTQAKELSQEFGTPLYVIDEAHFRARIRSYKQAFEKAYKNGYITFASKANSTAALMKIANQEGCAIDVASEGELRGALLAGVPASSCHLHGNNKQKEELVFAIEQGIDHIVADNFDELNLISQILKETGKPSPKIVLRLAPGVDPVTHAKISTGQADTKFGFNIADGSAEKAVTQTLALGLDLYGFHCHVGSQLLDPEAQRSGGQLIADFAVEIKKAHGFEARYLNVGGGLGIMYTENDVPMSHEDYCQLIVNSILEALEGSGIDPILAQEPGRSLIGESGLTLYTVGVIKTVPAKDTTTRTYVAVDGGLSDNPRPVMYGSKYTVERVSGKPASPTSTYTVSGKHCETDKLFPDIELPSDLEVGDLLQVLCTGAYNSSMASNYNRYQRPATVLVRPDGSYSLVQQREPWEVLFAREIIPQDL